ncbi:chromosome partitioning protein ParA [Tolypothrix bouteillei VB521301_2]|uniref:chromosome partitioning protein ParA n=1 Tax=Tolypothrix bouteillei TaxID=1246981 RepID=UPI0038B473B5
MSQNKNSKAQKMSDNNNTNNNSSKSINNQSQRRLVIITGDKGGVGKSTFARGLLQLYINKDLVCLAYEADQRNPQLERHYVDKYRPLIRYIDIFRKGQADQLLIDIDKEKQFPLFLLDLPAQSGGFFEKFVNELTFFEMLKDTNCRVTMVSVISRVLDSINVLEKLHELCQDKVDYVVVKNLFHGDVEKFERYNDSKIRKLMLSEGLVEIMMPDLFYQPYDFIDRYRLTFNDALTHDETNIAIRARVKSWIADFEEKTKPAFNLLGFDKEPLSGYYNKMVEETKKAKEKEEKQRKREVSTKCYR